MYSNMMQTIASAHGTVTLESLLAEYKNPWQRIIGGVLISGTIPFPKQQVVVVDDKGIVLERQYTAEGIQYVVPGYIAYIHNIQRHDGFVTDMSAYVAHKDMLLAQLLDGHDEQAVRLAKIARDKALCGRIFDHIRDASRHGHLNIKDKHVHPTLMESGATHFLNQRHRLTMRGVMGMVEFIEAELGSTPITQPYLGAQRDIEDVTDQLWLYFQLAMLHRVMMRYDRFLDVCMQLINTDAMFLHPDFWFNNTIAGKLIIDEKKGMYDIMVHVNESRCYAMNKDKTGRMTLPRGYILAKSVPNDRNTGDRWNIFPERDTNVKLVIDDFLTRIEELNTTAYDFMDTLLDGWKNEVAIQVIPRAPRPADEGRNI